MDDVDSKINNDNFSYKINIIKPQEKEEENINPNNTNLLCLNVRTPKRKKSKLQQKMESSYCIKTHKNENGSNGEKILKEFHKSKSVNKNLLIKSSPSLFQNKSINEKSSKNDDENKEYGSIENQNYIPEIKNSINYNININNSNANELLNILKFTNNLYTDDNHLQKEMPTKKVNINNLSKYDKNFNTGSTKKRLFIQFGMENNKKRKSFKSSNEMPQDNADNKDQKTNFSNYLKEQSYNEDNNYENNRENSDSEDNFNFNLNKNNINYVKGSSKSAKNSQIIFNKKKNSKKKKIKSKFNQEKSPIKKEKLKEKAESVKNVLKLIQTDKQSNRSIKSIKETPTVKNNDKEENPKKDDEKENKKKKKFNFCGLLCCLNS